MRAEDWAHWAIILEVAAFLLVTPQFLGEKVLKQISSALIRIAKFIIAAPDLLMFVKSSESEPSEFFAKVHKLVTDVRQFWKTPAVRPVILILVLAGPVLTMSVILLLTFPHYRWLGNVLVGIIVLGEVSFIVAWRSFVWRIIRSTPASGTIRHEISPPRWLVVFVLGPVLAIFLSLGIWGSLVPAYVLLKLSETDRLRNYLFGAGVAAFLASKAIEYSLVR